MSELPKGYTERKSGLVVPEEKKLATPSDSEVALFGSTPSYNSYKDHNDLAAGQLQKEKDEAAYKDILKVENILSLKEAIDAALSKLGTKSQNVNNGLNLAQQKEAIRQSVIEDYLKTGDKNRTITSEVREELNALLAKKSTDLEALATKASSSSSTPKTPTPPTPPKPSSNEGAPAPFLDEPTKVSTRTEADDDRRAIVTGDTFHAPGNEEFLEDEDTNPGRVSLDDRRRNPFASLRAKLGTMAGNYATGNTKFNSFVGRKVAEHEANGNKRRKGIYAALGALGVVGVGLLAYKTLNAGGHEVIELSSLGHNNNAFDSNLLHDHDNNHHSGSDTGLENHHQNHDIQYHYFDNDKIGENDFGSPLDADSKQDSLDDLRDRYKEDPALLASHLAAFDPRVDISDMNHLANEFDKDPKAMEQAVERLGDLQDKYNFRVENVTHDYSSLYMRPGPDGKPNIYQDNLVEHRGTMLVATDKDGHEVKIRRECGGQIIQEKEFKDVPDKFTPIVPPHEVETPPPTETKPPETKPPHETKPPETQPPETQPPETQPPETQPPETKPPETQPPETQPPETKPPETQPPETQPPETKPPETQPPHETPAPKDPSKDINVNPNLPDQVKLGDQAGTIPSGDPKPATDPPKTYTPPAAPQPEVHTPAPQAPDTTPTPGRGNTSSPSGETSGSTPSGNGAGETNNGSSGGSGSV